jgi:hypothetical protein
MTSRQLRIYERMFDPDESEDRRDHDYFLSADVKGLVKVLEAYCNAERKHPYAPREWQVYRDSVRRDLKLLGLSRTVCWQRQDHLPSDKSYVSVSINGSALTTGVACYLLYVALKTHSLSYGDKGANIWEYIPKEKKRTGLRNV